MIRPHLVGTRVRRAIDNRRGETITEVLVAMVIVGLALLVLAMVIASSSSIVRDSRESMEDFFSTGNQLSAFASEGEDTVTTSSGTVTLASGDGGALALSPSSGTTIDVTAFVSTNTDEPVVSYEEGEAS